MIAAGVDTHKLEHAICVLDALGQVIGERTISADRLGYAELARWIGTLDDHVVVGIEGAGSYGAGLCEHLLGAGIRVVEVERPKRAERRRGGKSDRIDALLAARKALAGDGLSTPRRGGTRQALGALLMGHRSCMRERTRLLNELQALVTTAPVALREQLGAGSGAKLATRLLATRRRAGSLATEQIILGVLRDLARRTRELQRNADAYKQTLETLIGGLDAALLNEPGIGPISAAKLLVCDPNDSPAKQPSRAATAPHRCPPPPARRFDTASHAAATARPTTRSTRSRSPARAATPKHVPTSTATLPKARPNEKPCAASNDTSPAACTND